MIILLAKIGLLLHLVLIVLLITYLKWVNMDDYTFLFFMALCISFPLTLALVTEILQD
jgi:hypothetical protein